MVVAGAFLATGNVTMKKIAVMVATKMNRPVVIQLQSVLENALNAILFFRTKGVRRR